LQARGYSVLQADAPPEAGSGIVSLTGNGKDLASLHRKLSEANIMTSLRVDRAGRQYLRLSPHFYNTDAELERAMGML
jgi:cysteine desulfurase / selenocysteine lyase